MMPVIANTCLGLVFPFSAAGTNTPSSYNTSWQGSWESATCLKPRDAQLGVSGMAVTARDTSARVVVDLVLKENQLLQQHYCFNKVDVLGEGSLEPVIVLNGRDTVRGVIGKELCHFDLPYYTDWLQLSFKGKGKYTVRGLYLDRPNAGFTLSEAAFLAPLQPPDGGSSPRPPRPGGFLHRHQRHSGRRL